MDLNNLKESKKQHTKKVKFNIDDIHAVYNCDWNECDYKSSHLNEYFNHISDHVDILWTEEWQSNRESITVILFLNNKYILYIDYLQSGLRVHGKIAHSNHTVK